MTTISVRTDNSIAFMAATALLGVHRDDRQSCGQRLFHGTIDVPELCVAILVVRSLFGLPVAL